MWLILVLCLPLVAGNMSGQGMWNEFGSGSAHGNFTAIDNVSFTCAARSFQAHEDLPYPSAFTTTLRIILTFFYIPTPVVAILLNALVVVLVAKYKKLHTLAFAMALQVVVLNIILSLVVLLLRPVSSIANQWLFGEVYCSLTGYVGMCGAVIKALLMFAFSLDRILSVFWLYSYPKYSFKIMVGLSVLAWLLPMAYFVLGFPGIWDCFGFVSEAYMCIYYPSCAQGCAIGLAVLFTIMLTAGFIIPTVFYCILYWKARQLSKAPVDQGAAGVPKRDWKTTIMFFLLFLVVSACTLPARLFSVLSSNLPQEASQASYVIYSLLLTLSTLSLALDPIVIMLHKDVRMIMAEVKRAVCQGPQGEEHPPAQGTQETPM